MPRPSLPLDRLPVRRAADLLLGPASLIRHGSVAVARSARSWELTLATLAGRELDGEVPRPTHAAAVVEDALEHDDESRSPTRRAGSTDASYAGSPDDTDRGDSQAMAAAASAPQPAEGGEPEQIDLTTSSTTGSADEIAMPPIEGWAEMSPQSASAAVSHLTREELDALITYEEAHGHRTAYLLMLRQRREEALTS